MHIDPKSSLLLSLLVFLYFLSLPVIFLGNDEFWETQKKGANFFNEVPTEQWFIDARKLGLEWVRLAYDKWATDQRDFLLGDASNYNGLVPEDLNMLKKVIGWAQQYNIQLVIAPLSLPGARWRQNNENIPDSRLWEDFSFWDQAIRFWVDLSEELGKYDNVVAFNILNEPHPELGTGVKEHYRPGDVSGFIDWYKRIQGTPRDIYAFYKRIIEAIRLVEPDRMIMLDAGWYGQPGAFCYWPNSFEDSNILYSFHMYEPYAFTSHLNHTHGNNYQYPGTVPFGSDTVYWDLNTTELYIQPFLDWVKKNGIPKNRVVAGEFGCMRKNEGAGRYLNDVIHFLNGHGFHWAFYAFREDAWDGYDYELGKEDLTWKYWQAVEKGEDPPLPRHDNDLFEIIRKQF